MPVHMFRHAHIAKGNMSMGYLSDKNRRNAPRNHCLTHIIVGHDLLHMNLLAGFPF